MTVHEMVLGRSARALRLENDRIRTTVLLDKGADIYELTYKPQGMDVLWKSPWGLKEPGVGPASAFDSQATWLEHYAGGWQELFPNGGDACMYKGVELGFHGEASMVPWDYQITGANSARLYTRLRRSPFTLERHMQLDGDRLHITGRITNHAGEPMDYMWSHHPAYGAPFLSAACRIDTGARTLLADDGYAGTANPLTLNTRYDWPGGDGVDMSQVPGPETARDTLAYLTDFESGWYAITNTELGFGVGLSWPVEAFPYAWYWQEMHASPGFPFYQNCYVMAIEPASSIPGQGLVTVMEKSGLHRTLAPGASAESALTVVFYDSDKGVSAIDTQGNVTLR